MQQINDSEAAKVTFHFPGYTFRPPQMKLDEIEFMDEKMEDFGFTLISPKEKNANIVQLNGKYISFNSTLTLSYAQFSMF